MWVIPINMYTQTQTSVQLRQVCCNTTTPSGGWYFLVSDAFHPRPSCKRHRTANAATTAYLTLYSKNPIQVISLSWKVPNFFPHFSHRAVTVGGKAQGMKIPANHWWLSQQKQTQNWEIRQKIFSWDGTRAKMKSRGLCIHIMKNKTRPSQNTDKHLKML